MNAALRTLRIGTAIVSFAGWNLWRRFGLIHPVQTPGERFAEALQGLGTTFVKLGQHLSLRPDLLPAGYIAALQNLQDHVAAFPASQARTTIEQALGAPVESVFSSFEPEPFAAASIAQVHGAILPDGRAVIVKVRRPGIAEQIDRDLRLALIAVRLAGGVIPGLKRYRLSQIVSEVWANLRREADFRLEARNVRRFAEALHGLPGIKVPDIEERLCRDSILVVERSHGARVDEVPDPVRGRALARRLVDAYLHQFFTIGAFHGDPHPGNLFITPEGEICFHDFGIVGTLDKATRRALAAFMLAFVEQDADWVVDAWFEMGVLAQQASERAVFRRIVAELLDDFSRMPLAQWSLGEAFQRLIAGGRGVGFGIPTNLLVLGRTMLLIESAVRALDPQFSLLDALLEKARAIQTTSLGAAEQTGALRFRYETALIASDWRLALAQALRQLRGDGFRLRVGSEELSRLSGSVEDAASRLATALVALGLYIAGSLLLQHGLGPQLGGLPLLAGAAYLVALWLTWRVLRRGRGNGA
jgi:ubiquinone biosynthesis protein